MKKTFALICIVFFIVLITPLFAQQQNTFILLKDGQRIDGKVEFVHPFLAKPYFHLNDTIKYTLAEVKAYQDGEGYFAQVRGNSFDISPGEKDALGSGIFVRRIRTGRISLFEYQLPFVAGTFSPAYPDSLTYHYFSKDNGDVQETSLLNLKKAMDDNPISRGHLNTLQILEYVQVGLIVSGIGIIVWGLGTSTEGRGLSTSVIVTGAVVGLLSWIPGSLKQGKVEEAIRAYNQ